MNSKDLMIGNWVIRHKKQIVKVAELYQTNMRATDRVWEYYKYIDGIPLTPEILEKAGFEKTKDENHTYWHNPETLLFAIANTTALGGGHYRFKAIRKPSSYLISNHIQYVHQLQNLYKALTGEELNIEL